MSDLVPTTSIQIVNPSTGEVLEQLHQQPAESLAEAVEAIQQHQAEVKTMLGALEGELRRRLEIIGRNQTFFGDYEVSMKQPRESVWDADQLEDVLRQLVQQGTLNAGECTGVIKREPQVSRSDADKLSKRLQGDPRAMVEDCREWRNKGAPKLTVTRSVPLIEEGE